LSLYGEDGRGNGRAKAKFLIATVKGEWCTNIRHKNLVEILSSPIML